MFDPVKRYKVWPVELMELEPGEALSAAEMVSELAVVVKAADYDRVCAALKVARQTILEVSHAQNVGPWWYTKGEVGLYEQVALHVRRGLDAVATCRADLENMP